MSALSVPFSESLCQAVFRPATPTAPKNAMVARCHALAAEIGQTAGRNPGANADAWNRFRDANAAVHTVDPDTARDLFEDASMLEAEALAAVRPIVVAEPGPWEPSVPFAEWCRQQASYYRSLDSELGNFGAVVWDGVAKNAEILGANNPTQYHDRDAALCRTREDQCRDQGYDAAMACERDLCMS